nr:MAG TPA: hypothetical protein [Caudoviricetes sp.]
MRGRRFPGWQVLEIAPPPPVPPYYRLHHNLHNHPAESLLQLRLRIDWIISAL